MDRSLRRVGSRQRSVKYQVLPIEATASPLQQQHSRPSSHRASPFLALTARRRAYVLSQPIRNSATVPPFRRALIRLRGVQMWTKLVQEVQLYGTGSGLLDQFRKYKECLPKVMQGKRRAERQPSLLETKVKQPIGWLFSPTAKGLSAWNFLVLGLLLYSFVIVPYNIAFIDGATVWDQVDIVVDVLFFIDILVTLNTALPGPHKSLVTSRVHIFKVYLCGWLLLDLLSIFPFDLLDIDSTGANNLVRFMRLAKFVRLVRGTKMIRLVKYFAKSDSMQKVAELLEMYSGITRLVTTLYSVLLLVHLAACLWYFSARLSNFSPDTWVVRRGIQDSEPLVLYLSSFYWAITTLATVGFGDIHAHTEMEMCICMAWMMFGVGFYSVIVGTLSSMLTSLDTKDMMINEKLQAVELYGKDTGLPLALLKAITIEIRQSAEVATLDEYQRFTLFSQVSKPLQLALAQEMFDCAASKVAFFQEIDSACLIHILPLMTRREVEAGVRLYTKGEYADEVYFVLEGRLACVYGDRNIAFKSVLRGAYWGEVELVETVAREYSLMTEQACDLLVMSKSVFESMMSEFPLVAQTVRDVARTRRLKTQECLNEILDIYEAVEVRKKARLEELAGKERVEWEKSKQQDVGQEVAEMMAGRTDEEVAGWLRRELAVMALEVEVSCMQGIKVISETTLKNVQNRSHPD